MQLKSHEEYDPINYACYAVTNITDDFTVNLLYPSGFVEYKDCDLFNIGDQTLIAFYHMGMYKDNFTYYIVSDNKTEKIGHQCYEWVIDVVNGDYQKDKSLFMLMNSVPKLMENYESLLEDPSWKAFFLEMQSRRCDLEEYGTVGFHDMTKTNGVDGPLLDVSYFTSDNLISNTLLINSVGNIHIVKTTFKDIPDSAYIDWPGCGGICRTLFGALKTAYQWSKCANEPWDNTTSLPIKCNQAMIDLDFSDEIITEMEEFSFPTVLERYLSNDPDPRRKIEEDENLPPNFKNWFISNLRYRTIGSLSSIHPLGESIPQSFLDKENQFFELIIYKFCIENNLDPKTADLADIFTIAHGSSYEEVNNSITDVLKKYLLTNPQLKPDLYVAPSINNQFIG
jgi:hypothetical protein